ncbi:hypothetical protein [Vibrio nigripulchritudo]|uniref:hypothetical protein n=1 Tax=Vibrio nigripulchritudo TaxID=28173 RepID=UPI00190C0C82|nr:hypothetical protein [Vibrio nigripulchritudo]
MTAVIFDLVDVKQGDQNRIAGGIAMSDVMRWLKRFECRLRSRFSAALISHR